MAKTFLDRANVKYEVLLANEHPDFVEKYGIKQAPTLVVVNGDKGDKYAGVSAIKAWIS